MDATRASHSRPQCYSSENVVAVSPTTWPKINGGSGDENESLWPELSFSDRWSRRMKLWERNWFTFAKMSEISATKLMEVSRAFHHATKWFFCQKKKKKREKKHAELSHIRQHVDSQRKLGEYSFSRYFFKARFQESFQPFQIVYISETARPGSYLSRLKPCHRLKDRTTEKATFHAQYFG